MIGKSQSKSGFSLMEMLVVVTIIGVLALAAVPVAEITFISLKEAELKENLETIRAAIQSWRKDCQTAVDKQATRRDAMFAPDEQMYPPSLLKLVKPDAGGYIIKDALGSPIATFYPKPYLNEIPVDPFVGGSVWTQHYADGSSPETYGLPTSPPANTGVFDIAPLEDPTERKGFEIAIDGTKYSDW